jgi:hypothetical protein
VGAQFAENWALIYFAVFGDGFGGFGSGFSRFGGHRKVVEVRSI